MRQLIKGLGITDGEYWYQDEKACNQRLTEEFNRLVDAAKEKMKVEVY